MGDVRYRTAIWVGLVSALALLTKAWAIPLAATVILAYAVAGRRARSFRSILRPAGVFLLVSMAGGWWWVRNLILRGNVQSAGHHRPLDTPLEPVVAVRRTLHQFVSIFPERLWAQLSIKYGEHAFAWWWLGLLTVVLVALIGIALVARSTPVAKSNVWLIVTPLALSSGILLAAVTFLTRRTGIAAGVQGRYLYPCIVSIAVLAAIGLGRLVRRSRAMVIPLAVFASGFAIVSYLRAISYHYGEDRWSNPLDSVRDMVAWSPMPSAPTWGLMVLVGGAAVWVVVESVRERTVSVADEAVPPLT